MDSFLNANERFLHDIIAVESFVTDTGEDHGAHTACEEATLAPLSFVELLQGSDDSNRHSQQRTSKTSLVFGPVNMSFSLSFYRIMQRTVTSMVDCVTEMKVEI